MKALGEFEMKIFRLFINLLLVVSLALGVICIPARASDEEYKTFIQTDPRWKDYVYDSGYKIGSSGCMITSIAVLMAYANPDLRDVNKFNPKILSDKLGFVNGGIMWGTTAQADSTFTIVGGGKYYSGGALSESSAISKIKECLDKGYYVIICTTGLYTSGLTHYSPIVGMENGKPIVWDVGGGKKPWSEWAKHGITQIVAYQSTKNKSGDVLGKSSSEANTDKELTEEQKIATQEIVKEWELQGMPESFSFEADVIFPDESSLTQVEKDRVESIKLGMESEKSSIYDTIHSIMSFIGLLLILYGVILISCYLFDRSNVLLDLELLKVVTFGHYMVWDDTMGVHPGRDRKNKAVYCTWGVILKRVLIIEFVGFGLLNNLFLNFIYRIFTFVSQMV